MAAPVTLPVLPAEILEEIVDFHAQLDENVDYWRLGGRKWSPSMLTLLSTSRQLRLCVIRHIFRDVDVDYREMGHPTSMDKLEQLVKPDSAADLPLGSIAPNIRSLRIQCLFDGYSHDPPSDISANESSKHFHTSLLDSIRKQSPLSTLVLKGFVIPYADTACSWNALPLALQRTITPLFQLPSLKRVTLHEISGIKGELFRGVPLQKLSIETSLELALFTHSAISVPNHHIISLSIDQSGIPEALYLPNLRHLSVSRQPYKPILCKDGQ
ncbi:hypothetical protein D9619_006662 [Psilocybe cf. subviscida]|uniref:Uncharacterized protein n=1 Tax=Psilocybe cf. subviscida TaxID=2480587 RepID=A0A8H5B3Y2_9AGAR|nr:hypothetical protein D9619_006662 [Psilocybe cf. subviscida]